MSDQWKHQSIFIVFFKKNYLSFSSSFILILICVLGTFLSVFLSLCVCVSFLGLSYLLFLFYFGKYFSLCLFPVFVLSLSLWWPALLWTVCAHPGLPCVNLFFVLSSSLDQLASFSTSYCVFSGFSEFLVQTGLVISSVWYSASPLLFICMFNQVIITTSPPWTIKKWF